MSCFSVFLILRNEIYYSNKTYLSSILPFLPSNTLILFCARISLMLSTSAHPLFSPLFLSLSHSLVQSLSHPDKRLLLHSLMFSLYCSRALRSRGVVLGSIPWWGTRLSNCYLIIWSKGRQLARGNMYLTYWETAQVPNQSWARPSTQSLYSYTIYIVSQCFLQITYHYISWQTKYIKKILNYYMVDLHSCRCWMYKHVKKRCQPTQSLDS